MFIAFILIGVVFLPMLNKRLEKKKIDKLNAIVTSLNTTPTDERLERFNTWASSDSAINISISSASQSRYCLFLDVSIRQMSPKVRDYPEVAELLSSLYELRRDQQCGE